MADVRYLNKTAYFISMTLFPNKPLLADSFCGVSLPKSIINKINNKEYNSAAQSLIQENLPFNQVVRLLANCPMALAAYFYKSASKIGVSPASQQIYCHLYLETQLGILSSIPPADKKAEIDALKKFINDYKAALDGKTVIKLIKHYGELTLLTDACIIFEDYESAVQALITGNPDYVHLLKLTKTLSVENQRQIFLRVIKSQKMKLIDFLDESSETTMSAIFDALCSIIADASDLNSFYLDNFTNLMPHLMLQGYFTSPIHFSMEFIFYIITKNQEKINEFIQSKNFEKADHDFIATYCASHNLFDLAARVYAHVKNRHLSAVRYIIKHITATKPQSKSQPILDLMKELDKSDDLKECWLFILRSCRDLGSFIESDDWKQIIQKATQKRILSLDDIFPLIPGDMQLDDLHKTISTAVGKSSADLRKSEETRKKILDRMAEQRRIVTDTSMNSIIVEPADQYCVICNQKVSDQPFDVYPCGHAVHFSCFRQNMANFLSGQELTNIVFGAATDNTKITSMLIDFGKRSCPACGTAALTILDKPLVDETVDYSAITKWEVPL